MRYLVLLLLSVILAGFVTWAWAAGKKVVFEAESYSSITPSMAKAVSSLVSGGAYTHVPLLRPHGVTEGAPPTRAAQSTSSRSPWPAPTASGRSATGMTAAATPSS